MSGISLASIMSRFTIRPHRQEQTRKVLDYLFENLDQGDNRRIDKDRNTDEDKISHGETPKHQKKHNHEEGQEDSAEESAKESAEIDKMALQLSNALHQYYIAINEFNHTLTTYKQTDTVRSRNIGDSADSLNLMDLAPTSGDGGRADWLRAKLQKLLPKKFLDASGVDRRELDRRQISGRMTAGSAKVLQSALAPHMPHLALS
ncbi:hypothetical protein BGZ57DRAFT_849926 [Hyaloscypha finlandica]|nr:hypothetical protein BGZ57DRAFT_849926 [Hyaloscypha finlandica]